MKALTVQQPWAAAIFRGKNVENRTQLWTYRGPLAIHAGTRWSARGSRNPLVLKALYQYDDKITALNPCAYDTGVILGTVELVDCHPEAGCCAPWGESNYVEHGGRERRSVTHLVLENPRRLRDPISCRGALSLWTPPPDVLDQIRRALP